MSTEIEGHILKKYEIKKRLGKGVRCSLLQMFFLLGCLLCCFGAALFSPTETHLIRLLPAVSV